MTRVIYRPGVPSLELRGHAGAGERGRDLLCASLSTLLYTLLASDPEAEAELDEGYGLVRGGAPGPYAYAAAGVRLLAQEYPQHVRLEVRE